MSATQDARLRTRSGPLQRDCYLKYTLLAHYAPGWVVGSSIQNSDPNTEVTQSLLGRGLTCYLPSSAPSVSATSARARLACCTRRVATRET